MDQPRTRVIARGSKLKNTKKILLKITGSNGALVSALTFSVLFLSFGMRSLTGEEANEAQSLVSVRKIDDAEIRVFVDGDFFASVRADYKGTPIVWPICGPNGSLVTRAWPMIDDVDVEDYYDANPSLYSRSTTNGVETIPLDEVRDSIRKELAMQEAADMAVTNLNAFIESLATNDLETFTWRCEARRMKTADTQLFPLEGSYLPGIEHDAVKEFRETAHDLDATRDDSRYGVAAGREFVYLLRATTNDYAHTQPLEEVKEAIRPLTVASMRHKKFIASAEEAAAKLKAALAADPAPAFADAAASVGLVASTSIVFSADSLSPSAFENARAIAPVVARLKTGAISEPIEVYGGAVLACVSAREPADAVATDSVREQARSMMSSAYGAAAFQDWLLWNLNRKGFTSSRAVIYTASADEDVED